MLITRISMYLFLFQCYDHHRYLLVLSPPFPSRPASDLRLGRAGPVPAVHVGCADLDAVLAGVADELRRRVEAHRLAVQQRGGEDRRVMVLHPGDRKSTRLNSSH